MIKKLILLILILFSISSVNASLIDSTVHYWDLEDLGTEHGGVTLYTSGSPSSVTGINGNGYRVTGSGSGATGGNQVISNNLDKTQIEYTDDYCVSLWANYGVRLAGGYTMWGIFDSSNMAFPSEYTGVSVSDNAWYVDNYLSSNTAEYGTTNDANFHQVLFCQDYTNGRVYAWEDNVLKINESKTFGADTSDKFLILGATGLKTYGSTGDHDYDEIAIFNKVLDSSERGQLYNSGSGCFYGDTCYSGTILLTTNITDYYSDSNIIIEVNASQQTNLSYILNGGANISFGTATTSENLSLSLVEGQNNLTIYTDTSEESYNLTLDTTNPSLEVNLNSEFNSFDNFDISNNLTYSDDNLDTCLVTITGGDVIDCTNNSYSFTNSGNISFNVTVTDLAGNSNTSLNNVMLVNPYAYLYFEDQNSNSVESFSLDSISYNNYSQIKYYNDGLVIGENTLFFEALGMKSQNISFNLTTSSPAFNNTFSVETAKIVLTIYDLSTNDLLTETVNVELIETNFTGSTSTGYLNISQVNFYDGEYTLNLDSTNYESEALFFTYSNREELIVNAYMLPTNTTNLGVLNVKTETSLDVISGQLVNLQAWSSSDSAYITVGQSKTDSNGDAFFNVELGTTFYKATASRGTEVKTSPEQKVTISGTIIYLTFSDNIESYTDINSQSVLFNLTNTTYNSTHETIVFSWQDPNNLVSEACLNINRLKGSLSTELSSNCVSSPSGEVEIITAVNNSFTKEALATIYEGSKYTRLDNIIYQSNLNLENATGSMAKWIVLGLVVAVLGIGIVLVIVELIGLSAIVGAWTLYSLFPETLGYTIPLLITIVSVLIIWGTFKKRF